MGKQRGEKLFSITEKDFRFESFRAGGPGGQYQNTTDSAVRIIHKETGLSAESRTERSQYQNKKLAFQNLVRKPEFQQWLKMKSAEMMGQIPTEEEIKEKVEEWMKPENLKIETYRG